MSRDGAEPGAFPWDWLYFRAVDCGLSAEDFWRSSPRAIHLLYTMAREARQGSAPARGRGSRPSPGRRGGTPVRLSRLPHP